MLSRGRPGALLCVGDYHGTLAAVRSLGRAGVTVAVADWRRLVAARWSRFTARAERCPEVGKDPEAFLAWLEDEGRRHPGQVLLATTDELAWLFARHRDALQRHFLLDTPPLATLSTLLNKVRLAQACEAVGLACPPTWLPPDEGALDRLAPRLAYPLVVKPQTQVLLSPHQKGRVVAAAGDLQEAVRDFLQSTRHHPLLLRDEPQAWRPMLQSFVSDARGVLSVSGFVEPSGELRVARGARKVFQRPRLLGVGLCFEGAEAPPALVDGLRALCRHTGYHGVFEAEFLEGQGAPQLIDFNPRFYGQLAFDVARGADLPRLAYLAAAGDGPALRRAVEQASSPDRSGAHAGATAYCDRLNLELFLAAELAVGRHPEDAPRWHGWVDAHQGALADALLDPDDWLPAVVEAPATVLSQVLHPRATLRQAREG